MDLVNRLSLQSLSLSTLPYIEGAPSDSAIPARATGVVDVNLGAIQRNYATLCRVVGSNVPVVPVVKANAYGIGIEPVAQALWASGARAFFVADVNEGIELRSILPNAELYILAGVWEGTEALFEEYALTPVLIHDHQVALWKRWAFQRQKCFSAALHIDTGMRRTGIPLSDLKNLVETPHAWEGLDLKIVMSHLACAADPDHMMNRHQLRLFKEYASFFEGIPASLAASAGIFMGPAYHFDLVRPGMLLYGLRPNAMHMSESLQPCLRVAVRILQVQEADTGDTVGYSATYRFGQRTRIATLALGHADGYLRPLSNQGVVMIAGHTVPIVGRVSMDLLTVDVSQVPESLVYPGQWAEIINNQIGVHDVARHAHTIAHEVLVRLGSRYHRRYYL